MFSGYILGKKKNEFSIGGTSYCLGNLKKNILTSDDIATGCRNLHWSSCISEVS